MAVTRADCQQLTWWTVKQPESTLCLQNVLNEASRTIVGHPANFPKMTYMHTLSVLPEPFQCHSGPSPDSTSFARCHHYPENNNRTCPKPEWAIPQYFIYLLIWWLKMLFLYAKKGELSVIEHKLSCREYETFLFAILLLLRMSHHTLCHTLPFAIFNHF